MYTLSQFYKKEECLLGKLMKCYLEPLAEC